MIALLITVVIYGLIFYLLHWFIGFVGLPQPFYKIAIVLIALGAIIVLIGILTGSVHPFPILNGL